MYCVLEERDTVHERKGHDREEKSLPVAWMWRGLKRMHDRSELHYVLINGNPDICAS